MATEQKSPTGKERMFFDQTAPSGPTTTDPTALSYVAGVDLQNTWTVDENAGYDYPVDWGSGPQGPLANLYRNPYKQNAISYPRDLGFLDKGHSVQFDIRDIKPIEIGLVKMVVGGINEVANDPNGVTKKILDNSVELSKKAGEAIQNKSTSEILQSSYEAATDYGISSSANMTDNAKEQFSQMVRSGGGLNPQLTANPVDTIRLYMPDSLQFDYNAQYDKLSLAEAINSVPLVGKVSSAITSFLEGNKMAQAIQKKIGYTFNPQQQTLFEGIDFREFTMDFIFTPTSQTEAVAVQQIITKLRLAAAPTKQEDLGGFFFIPPSVFDITFFFNRQINYSIPPIRQCVLQTVAVNYAPNGWAAMHDGSPVQTAVTLSFKEIDLVDRNSIRQEKQMTVR